MDYTYTVIFEPAEEGGYLAHIPTLGTTTEGATLEEARAMAKDLITSRIEALIKLGRPVPQETVAFQSIGEQITATLHVSAA